MSISFTDWFVFFKEVSTRSRDANPALATKSTKSLATNAAVCVANDDNETSGAKGVSDINCSNIANLEGSDGASKAISCLKHPITLAGILSISPVVPMTKTGYPVL